jgi:hypothetical protein
VVVCQENEAERDCRAIHKVADNLQAWQKRIDHKIEIRKLDVCLWLSVNFQSAVNSILAVIAPKEIHGNRRIDPQPELRPCLQSPPPDCRPELAV